MARFDAVTLVAFGDMLRVPVNAPTQRAALAGAGAGGGRRRAADRRARPRRSRSPGAIRRATWCSSPPASRPRPRRSRRCWPRACRPTSTCCCLAGAPGRSSRSCSNRARRASTRWWPPGTSPRSWARRNGSSWWTGTTCPRRWRASPRSRCSPRPIPCCASAWTSRPFLDNCYPSAVRAGGSPAAREILDAVFRGRRRQLARHRHRAGLGLRPARALQRRTTRACDSRRTATRRASVPGRCRPAAIAPAWCSDASTRTSAACSVPPARHAIRSAPAWCPTKAPAASGGRADCASRPTQNARAAPEGAWPWSRSACSCRGESRGWASARSSTGWRTASAFAGRVWNALGQVTIEVQGTRDQLGEFARELVNAAPPLARPQIEGTEDIDPDTDLEGFAIVASDAGGPAQVHVPPDQFACDDCLAELADPGDRRYRHPFINCTQCGPRYTLIERLPYDRANTTMSRFALCDACQREYLDPLDRRYHAEPLACPRCGPQAGAGRGGSRDAAGGCAARRHARDGRRCAGACGRCVARRRHAGGQGRRRLPPDVRRAQRASRRAVAGTQAASRQAAGGDVPAEPRGCGSAGLPARRRRVDGPGSRGAAQRGAAHRRGAPRGGLHARARHRAGPRRDRRAAAVQSAARAAARGFRRAAGRHLGQPQRRAGDHRPGDGAVAPRRPGRRLPAPRPADLRPADDPVCREHRRTRPPDPPRPRQRAARTRAAVCRSRCRRWRSGRS